MKSKRDSDEYEYKTENLTELQLLEKEGHIDVYYGDEAGFSLNCVVPYAWQFPKEQVTILPQRGKTINVLGFMNHRGNQVVTFSKQGTVNAEFVIESIDTFATKLLKPTVLVLDNARIHHAKIFQERMTEWEEKNLYIFFLPPYSPHLNRIEILWRKTKYYWIRPQDYQSLDSLQTALDTIWASFGQEKVLNFRD